MQVNESRIMCSIEYLKHLLWDKFFTANELDVFYFAAFMFYPNN
jgi:hypothetical protein